jgi:hypothetical protein
MRDEQRAACLEVIYKTLLALRSDVLLVAFAGSAQVFSGFVTSDPGAIVAELGRAVALCPRKPLTDLHRALAVIASRFKGDEMLKAITVFSDFRRRGLYADIDESVTRGYRQAMALPGLVAINDVVPGADFTEFIKRGVDEDLHSKVSRPIGELPMDLRRLLS